MSALTNQVFTVLFSLLFLAACNKKNESPDPNRDPDRTPMGFIPREGKVYHYHLTDHAGRTGSSITRVTKAKDTLETKIFDVLTRITNQSGAVSLDSMRSYSHGGHTYHIMVANRLYDEYLSIRGRSSIVEIQLRGYPQVMKLDNRGELTSKMEFPNGNPGGRTYLYYQEQALESGYYEVWETLKYTPGGVVAKETVETPAGKFTCSKWQYEYADETGVKYPDDPDIAWYVSITREMLWLADGVGVVKAVGEVYFNNQVVRSYESRLMKIE